MRNHPAMVLIVFVVDYLIPWVIENVEQDDIRNEIIRRFNSLKHYLHGHIHSGMTSENGNTVSSAKCRNLLEELKERDLIEVANGEGCNNG